MEGSGDIGFWKQINDTIMKKTFLFLLILLCIHVAEAQKVKVACVGNSITYGAGIENREVNCYPAQLQRLLGDAYEVRNFGHSGATLLNKAYRPYTQQEAYQNALRFGGDRVVIHLGVNDTDPRAWPNYRDDFVKDYLSLIESFRQANPMCEIWICRMSPIAHRHPRFQSGTRDWFWLEQGLIEQIAKIAGVKLIDFQEGLYERPDLLPDAIHPNTEGAGILAQAVREALTGNYGGLRMPIPYTDQMVLQRDQPLPVSGIANVGEKVTVTIAGQKQETIAGTDGKWSITLSPLTVKDNPCTLTISTPSRTLTYKDVLAGEVWLCSGQSNMAFRVNESVKAEQDEQLGYAGKHPAIRLFDMKPRWETLPVEWDASVLDSLNRLEYYQDTRWIPCDAASAARFSAVGFAFGRMLADSLQVPVGLILNAVGGSPTEAWVGRKTLEFEFPGILYDWKQNDFIQGWVRERASQNIQKATNPLQRHPYEPCYLFEAGIRPLQQYLIKGIIWYQGESNAHNMEAHEKLFSLLVDNWRHAWKIDLPFYYVQLSSIDRPSWTWFRDNQRQLMSRTPNTGMAVSSDHGDSLDVHPRYKKEVGERLARWALNKTYGHNVTPSGPLFRNVAFSDNAAYVTFDYANGLKTSDGQPIRTFEIADQEGLYYPAQAEIHDRKIKVWSEKVSHPRLIRYGWQPFTRANLVNGEGIPASTFRALKSE